MNHRNGRKQGRIFSAILMMTGVLGLLALAESKAEAYDFYGGLMSPAATLTSVSNATVTATTSTPVQIVQNADLLLSIGLVCTNTGTSNVICGFNLQMPDGSWTSTNPILATNSCSGTTGQTNFVLISQAVLHTARAIRWDYTSTTQTNTVSLSVRWGQYN